MEKDSRIYVAGHRGLVGSALVRSLRANGYDNLLLAGHKELDLLDQASTREFFRRERPQYVFVAAAKVGGIGSNASHPACFIHDNLLIAVNVIDSAWRNGAKKLLFLGSSCIYPKFAPQPIPESALLSGHLEPTNDAYALAKISAIRMASAYRQEYGFDAISVMPCNLYGEGDNFDVNSSHVLPALIRRFHEAKIAGAASVSVWGTGKPLREFMHVDDLAAACLFLMDNYSDERHINVGSGEEISIYDLALLVADVIGYKGDITLNPAKPDGTPRKVMDNSRIFAMGWRPSISLRDGIARTYAWYQKNYASNQPTPQAGN